MSYLLLLHRHLPGLPLLLAVNRGGPGPSRPLTRPGLRLGRHALLGSWDRATGRVWVAVGDQGLVAALVCSGLDTLGPPPGPPDLVAQVLEAGTAREGARLLAGGTGDHPPFRLVLADLEEAWLVQAGAEAAGVEVRELARGVTALSPSQGPGVLTPADLPLGPAGRAWWAGGMDRPERWEAADFRLQAVEGGGRVEATAVVGLTGVGPPRGILSFATGAGPERELLDYANLYRRF